MEDSAPERLLQGVARDDRHRSHAVSPPTASRYSSSRRRCEHAHAVDPAGPRATSCCDEPGNLSRPASGRAGRPRRSRSPRLAAARDPPAGPAATTRPCDRITTRSQTSSISLRRCELSRTPISAFPQVLEQCADRSPARRVERARRLVEQEHGRRADERLRDPEPLLHSLRHRVDPHARGRPRARRARAARPRSSTPPGEPASRWWRRSTSSAEYQPGKRKSSAR